MSQKRDPSASSEQAMGDPVFVVGERICRKGMISKSYRQFKTTSRLKV